jgi:hypothetical protein
MPAGNRGLISLLAAALLACSQNPAPRGWLPPPRAAQSDPYGAWIVVWSPAWGEWAGEFLAVERDTVFLLTPDSVVRAVPIDSIREAELAFYDAQWGGLSLWTGVGSVATISNGAFLVITLPMWLIGGSAATGGQSRAPLRRVRQPGEWDGVRMFARFPTGLPPGLPRRLLPRDRRPGR